MKLENQFWKGRKSLKIENIKDIEKFFEIIEKCEVKVEIVSKEGDQLNAKSKLSQLVLISNFFTHPIIRELELIAENPKDKERLIHFMMYGN